MKKAISIFLVVSLLLGGLSGCANYQSPPSDNAPVTSAHDSPPTVVEDNTPYVPIITKKEDCWYRDLIYTKFGDNKDELIAVYDELTEAVSQCKKQITLSYPVAERTLEVLYKMVVIDHPEFYHIRQPEEDGAFVLRENSDRDVFLYYHYDLSEVAVMNAQIEYYVQPILEEASKFESDLDKCTYLYYWIVDNTKVNWDLYNPNPHSTIAEMFIEKHGVCIGYSHALTYLYRRMGISAMVGTGRNDSGITHTFTIAQFGDTIYASDPYYGNYQLVSVEDSVANFFNMDSFDTLIAHKVTPYTDLEGPALGKVE